MKQTTCVLNIVLSLYQEMNTDLSMFDFLIYSAKTDIFCRKLERTG